MVEQAEEMLEETRVAAEARLEEAMEQVEQVESAGEEIGGRAGRRSQGCCQ